MELYGVLECVKVIVAFFNVKINERFFRNEG